MFRTGTALLLFTGQASAQDLSDFHLHGYSGHFELRSEYWDEARSGLSSSLRQKELLFREELQLRLLGDYYHPKFLEYDLTTKFGLEQRTIDSSGTAPTKEFGQRNLLWDFRTSILKDLPYSGQVYSYRSEIQTRQSFFETTEAVTSETGANLFAKDWWIPSRLHVHDYRYEGQGRDTYRERRSNALIEGTRVTDDAQYRYSAQYNDVNLPSSGVSFEDYDAYASSTTYSGDRRQNRWTNQLRFRQQEGSIDSLNIGANSEFHKAWTTDLWSNHGLQYTRTEISGSPSESISATSSLGHQLFSSLTSSASANLGRTEFDQGSIGVYGLKGQAQYTKSTPIGQLGLSYLADFYVQDQETLGITTLVVDESHAVDFGIPIYLDSPSVDHATVVVTNDTGLTVYTEGIDYVLLREGSRTRVEIPIGSLIVVGQTLLIDYMFQPNPAIEFSNMQQTAGLSLRIFDYASFDIQRSTVRQDLVSGVDTGILHDSDRTSISLQAYPGTMTLGIRYEDLDSPFTPYERTTFLASNQTLLRNGFHWSISASTYKTRFDGIVEDESGTNASTGLLGSLGRSTYWECRGEWHDVDYRTDRGSGYLLESNIAKSFRMIDIVFRLRYTNEDFDVASDQEILYALVTIRRRF